MVIETQIEVGLHEPDTMDTSLEQRYQSRSSLSTLPVLSHATFTMVGWNQPAESIGGDYYHWLTGPDDRLWFSLADVSGHGPASAVIAKQYHASFLTATTMTQTLENVMQHLNTWFCQLLSPRRFITAAVGVLEPSTCRLRFSSAGHGPIFFYNARADVMLHWRAHTIPLGITRDSHTSVPRDLILAPGDMLVLVTDGFFEWANPGGELFGLDRLQEAIYARRHQAPNTLITSLYHEVVDFTAGTQQPDDLTIVILKRTDTTPQA